MSLLKPDQIAFYEREGYLIVDDLFTSGEASLLLQIARHDPKLKAETKANRNYDEGSEGRNTVLAYRGALSDDAYSSLVRSRRVVSLLEQLLGDAVLHYYHLIMQKDPGTGGWQYHQDYGYHYQEFLRPDYLSFMVALEPAVPANGCLRVYPASHRLGRLEHQWCGSQLITDPERVALVARHYQEIHCPLRAGSVLFFHGNLLHASDANLSQHGRWSVVCSCVAARNPWVRDPKANKCEALEAMPDAQFSAALQRCWTAVAPTAPRGQSTTPGMNNG